MWTGSLASCVRDSEHGINMGKVSSLGIDGALQWKEKAKRTEKKFKLEQKFVFKQELSCHQYQVILYCLKLQDSHPSVIKMVNFSTYALKIYNF